MLILNSSVSTALVRYFQHYNTIEFICIYYYFLQIFTNIIITGSENEILDMIGYDSDSSSDDWDNSLDSTELNYSATDEDSDNENREVISNMPILSKFLVTC